jgi:hypothetical protein
MSARLRASAYTAYHVTAAASRFEAAVIEAACVWHEASRNLTDAKNSLRGAKERGNEFEIAVQEYAVDSARTYAEHEYQQLHLLVCGFAKPDHWQGKASNGHYYLVKWSGPIIAQVSIDIQS